MTIYLERHIFSRATRRSTPALRKQRSIANLQNVPVFPAFPRQSQSPFGRQSFTVIDVVHGDNSKIAGAAFAMMSPGWALTSGSFINKETNS